MLVKDIDPKIKSLDEEREVLEKLSAYYEANPSEAARLEEKLGVKLLSHSIYAARNSVATLRDAMIKARDNAEVDWPGVKA